MPDKAEGLGPPETTDRCLRLRHSSGREVNIGERDLWAMAGLAARLSALEAGLTLLFRQQMEFAEQLAHVRALLEPLE